jgi:predicted phage terminase large subunit-like protein
VADVGHLIRALAGYSVHADKKTGNKADMAKPLSAQISAGNVRMVRAPWNDSFTRELDTFDGTGKGVDDQVDASSGAFSKLTMIFGFSRLN